ncbi:Uma2 family endonuclease [Caloramator mitchellensis]|nr:Uma2 family endonuclease [Caloramator mitchellensis]
MALPKKIDFYTYKDYINIDGDSRVELIDGQFFAMSPAPSRIHQKIVTEGARIIGNFIAEKGLNCEVYVAPFDVRLIDEGGSEDTCKNVVQPDISVVCDKNKLDDKGCKGAPDFIIEVVSPSNASIDYVKKLYLYEKFKVKEYWIINPDSKNVLVYTLNNEGQYGEPQKYRLDEQVQCNLFKELEFRLDEKNW